MSGDFDSLLRAEFPYMTDDEYTSIPRELLLEMIGFERQIALLERATALPPAVNLFENAPSDLLAYMLRDVNLNAIRGLYAVDSAFRRRALGIVMRINDVYHKNAPWSEYGYISDNHPVEKLQAIEASKFLDGGFRITFGNQIELYKEENSDMIHVYLIQEISRGFFITEFPKERAKISTIQFKQMCKQYGISTTNDIAVVGIRPLPSKEGFVSMLYALLVDYSLKMTAITDVYEERDIPSHKVVDGQRIPFTYRGQRAVDTSRITSSVCDADTNVAQRNFCFGCKKHETATVREARNQLTFCGMQCQSAFYAEIGGSLLMLQETPAFGLDMFVKMLRLNETEDDYYITRARWSLVDSMILDGTAVTRKKLLKWIETDALVQRLLFGKEIADLSEIIKLSVQTAVQYNLPALLLVINLHGMAFNNIFESITGYSSASRLYGYLGPVSGIDRAGYNLLNAAIAHNSIHLLDVLLRKFKFSVGAIKFFFERQVHDMLGGIHPIANNDNWQQLWTRLFQECSLPIQKLFEQFLELHNTFIRESGVTPVYASMFNPRSGMKEQNWRFGNALKNMCEQVIRGMITLPDNVWMPESTPDKRAKRGQ